MPPRSADVAAAEQRDYHPPWRRHGRERQSRPADDPRRSRGLDPLKRSAWRNLGSGRDRGPGPQTHATDLASAAQKRADAA